jgi:hypothetical protein
VFHRIGVQARSCCAEARPASPHIRLGVVASHTIIPHARGLALGRAGPIFLCRRIPAMVFPGHRPPRIRRRRQASRMAFNELLMTS